MKKYIFIILLIVSQSSFCQDPIDKPIPYSRSSIATIFLEHTDLSYGITKYFDAVSIPNRFDYNYFGNNGLHVDIPMYGELRSQYDKLSASLLQVKDAETLKSIRAQIKELKPKVEIEDSLRLVEINQKVKSSRIAAQILSSILIDANKKVMTTDVLDKRSEYNASDADYISAMNSERKIGAIRDKGLTLLGNTYFIIYEINALGVTKSEESNASNYSMSGKAYLYKIQIDSLINNGQFDQLVFLEPDESKLVKFINYDFPIKQITSTVFTSSVSNSAESLGKELAKSIGKSLLSSLTSSNTSNNSSSQIQVKLKSDDEVYKSLISSVVLTSTDEISKNYDPFLVKSPIFNKRPIEIKIGKKEDVKIDHLFKVTETRLRRNGEKYTKTVGWIRARKISDNLANATGNTVPSKFYKVGSKSLDKGMLASYKPQELLIGYQHYAGIGLMNGPTIGIEYITHTIKGFRIGANFGGFNTVTTRNAYDILGKVTDNPKLRGMNLYGDVSLNQTLQLNKFELTPMVLGGISAVAFTKLNGELMKEGDTGYQSSATTIGVGFGGKFGINFGPKTQLILGYKEMIFGKSILRSKDGDAFSDINSVDFAPSHAAIIFGLRFMAF